MKAFVWHNDQPYDGEPFVEWHSPRTPGRAHGLWLFTLKLPLGYRFVARGGKHRNV